ncbi:hypothetical protein BGZ58_008728 [Dissophora ornata]|nr:hypothetical protein BGZ58_008728 [Dissophora ornata]
MARCSLKENRELDHIVTNDYIPPPPQTAAPAAQFIQNSRDGTYRGDHLDLPEYRGGQWTKQSSTQQMHNIDLDEGQEHNRYSDRNNTPNRQNIITERSGRRRSLLSSRETVRSSSSDSTKNRTPSQTPYQKSATRVRSQLKQRFRFPVFKHYDPSRYKMKGMGRLAQFSNERLYLHWIRFGVLQGSIAVMLLSFGIGIASFVGVGALVLSLMTLIYGTTIYHKRHLYLVKKRQDVKYFARTVPTLLTMGLFVLYGANFVITLSYGEDARSPPPWTQHDDSNFDDYF